MNIFILDNNIEKSVQYYVDRHMKIILEISQMLCTAHFILKTNYNTPYKPCFIHHPCCKWVSKTKANYLWTCDFGLQLCKENLYRFNKEHKSKEVILWAQNNIPNFSLYNLTPFVQAMPIQYKHENAVIAYLNYYNREKQHLFKWTKRNIPYWIKREDI
jgi:hypothetical protein